MYKGLYLSTGKRAVARGANSDLIRTNFLINDVIKI